MRKVGDAFRRLAAVLPLLALFLGSGLALPSPARAETVKSPAETAKGKTSAKNPAEAKAASKGKSPKTETASQATPARKAKETEKKQAEKTGKPTGETAKAEKKAAPPQAGKATAKADKPAGKTAKADKNAAKTDKADVAAAKPDPDKTAAKAAKPEDKTAKAPVQTAKNKDKAAGAKRMAKADEKAAPEKTADEKASGHTLRHPHDSDEARDDDAPGAPSAAKGREKSQGKQVALALVPAKSRTLRPHPTPPLSPERGLQETRRQVPDAKEHEPHDAPSTEAEEPAAPAKSYTATASTHYNCVQYVKQVTELGINGDGYQWWDHAAGRYGRGAAPQPGAVMVFARTDTLPHGHVAIVRSIRNNRTILVDHANWSLIHGRKGQVERAVAVVDTSAANDWSKVRVWYQPTADIGQTVYPILGFVYPEAEDEEPSPPRLPLRHHMR